MEEFSNSVSVMCEQLHSISTRIVGFEARLVQLEENPGERNQEHNRKRSRKHAKKYKIAIPEMRNAEQTAAASALMAEIRRVLVELISPKVIEGEEGEDGRVSGATMVEPIYHLDFNQPPTHPTNMSSIEHTIEIVLSKFRAQDGCTYEIIGVSFTEDDAKHFAVQYFYSLRYSYQIASDSMKAKKLQRHERIIRRLGRSRTHKTFVLSGKKRYEEKFNKKVPDDVIDTDAFSEYASQYDSSDLEDVSDNEGSEARRARLDAAIAARADKLQRLYPHASKVWEVRKKTYCSEEFLQLISDMRECAKEARRETRASSSRRRKGGDSPQVTPSIDLGRPVHRAPMRSVYPFQVSGEWRINRYREAQLLEEKPDDPIGFGYNVQL